MIGKTSQAGGRRQYNEIYVLIKVWTECCSILREDFPHGGLWTEVLMGEETFLGSEMGVI